MSSEDVHITPIIGDWYTAPSLGIYFEVVAVDSHSGAIEVQLLDGEITEFELDNWRELELNPAQPPEDAGAAFELCQEDRVDSELLPNAMNDPLGKIEPELFPGIDDF